MGDLISRSALIEMIDNDIDMTKRFMDKITNPLEMASRNYIALSSQLNTLKSFRTIIAEQKTAYNVENVVEELEKEIQWAETHGTSADFRKGRISGLKTAIRLTNDIVKRGGVDG